MSQNIEIIPGANKTHESSTFFIPSLSVAVSMAKHQDDGPNPTVTVKDPLFVANAAEPIWPWGDDNMEPQHIFKDIFANDFLMPAIEKKAKLIHGQGLSYFRVAMKQNKTTGLYTEVLEPFNAPEINRWLRDINFDSYVHQCALNKFATGNFFPEIILAKYVQKVNRLHCIDSTDCRLGVQDIHTGTIKKSFISANWDTMDTRNMEAIPVDVIDQHINAVQHIGKNQSIKKFILPIRALVAGEKYYAHEPLRGLRKSGWLKISADVPRWQVAVMKQSGSIKYHLEIDEAWWEWKYPGFKGKEEKVRFDLMTKEITNFIETMTGVDNAGNVLMSSMRADPQSRVQYSGWKITPIDNSKFEGSNSHLEYAQEADLRTIRALGMHPTLFGAARGKGSAGSGSDIRVAQNTAILESKPDQDEILHPLRIASEVNGWNKQYANDSKYTGEIRWMFNSYYVARLDSGKEISDKPEAKDKAE